MSHLQGCRWCRLPGALLLAPMCVGRCHLPHPHHLWAQARCCCFLLLCLRYLLPLLLWALLRLLLVVLHLYTPVAALTAAKGSNLRVTARPQRAGQAPPAPAVCC